MQTNEELFLKKLSDGQLIFDTKEAVKAEREATSVVVKYFREIYSRELYLKYACTSLFDFATKELGYCDGSAQSRINAMKLVIALPEVEKKIETGELSLTAASNLQSFFQIEKKIKKTYSAEEKLEVVKACCSKSTREVKIELASRNPIVVWVETVRPVSKDRFELKFTVTDVLEQKIRKLKGLLAHSCPNMKTEELFETLVELGLEKFDPVRRAERAEKREDAKHKTTLLSSKEEASVHAHETPAKECSTEFHAHESTAKNSLALTSYRKVSSLDRAKAFHAHETNVSKRYIPAETRHEVWLRNGGRGCEFQSETGEMCGSHHALQIDHVQGFAIGGVHAADNLRILCAKHNRFVWNVQFKRPSRSRSVVREAVVLYSSAS